MICFILLLVGRWRKEEEEEEQGRRRRRLATAGHHGVQEQEEKERRRATASIRWRPDNITYGHVSSNKRRRRRRREERNNSDFLYSSRSVKRRRRRTTDDEDIYHSSRSSDRSRRKTRREDRNYSSRRDISYGNIRSSNRKVGDSSDKTTRRRREESRSKSNRCRHDSPDSCSHPSVITEEKEEEEDIDFPVGSTKCDDVSCKLCEDETNADTTPVGSFPCFVDDGLLTQILTRLPVKPLLRFKSVCKRWLSLITRDPHFIHLQLTRSESRPKLLCIAPLRQQQKETLPQRILSADLSVKTSISGEGEVPQVIIHNAKKITDDNWFNYDQVLEPVNGLVCFIHWRTAAARIYNVGTREVTPWIKSTLLAEEKGKFESQDSPVEIVSNLLQIYQMGFDPETKEHKVFCFWRLSEPFRGGYICDVPGYASWEALTLGRDTKWRRIAVVPDENNSIEIKEVLPPDCPGRSPVHANGSIYWRNKGMSSEYDLIYPKHVARGDDYAPSDPDVIIAFDVGSEKYRVIPIPSFILDEPREKMLNRPIAMLVLGGLVTLIYQMSRYVLKLWMLDDGVEKKQENCRGKGSCNWSAETITLPYNLDTRFCNFHGVPTSADIILISLFEEIGDTISAPKVGFLISYDRKAKTCWDGDMDRNFSVPLHGNRSLFTTFTESLIPVQPQQDN